MDQDFGAFYSLKMVIWIVFHSNQVKWYVQDFPKDLFLMLGRNHHPLLQLRTQWNLSFCFTTWSYNFRSKSDLQVWIYGLQVLAVDIIYDYILSSISYNTTCVMLDWIQTDLHLPTSFLSKDEGHLYLFIWIFFKIHFQKKKSCPPFLGFISLMWFRHWQSLGVKIMNWRILCSISSSAQNSTCLVIVSAEGTLVLISVALLMRKPLLFIKRWGLLSFDFIWNRIWPNLSLAKIAIAEWKTQLACPYLTSSIAYVLCQVLQMNIFGCLCCYCWKICSQCTQSAVPSIMQKWKELKYLWPGRALGIFSWWKPVLFADIGLLHFIYDGFAVFCFNILLFILNLCLHILT